MEGGVESLNAAVAGSLALYELRRRRSGGTGAAGGAGPPARRDRGVRRLGRGGSNPEGPTG
jgi:hypothetical protein